MSDTSPPPSDSTPPPPRASCPRCGNLTAHPFAGAGGVCLRCAGERALALGTDVPFESVNPHASSAAPPTDTAAPLTALDPTDPPARIGRYEIIEELGRGGMGRVYAARQSGLGRIVALKVLSLGPGSPPEWEMRFLREAQTVARLRHPHIIAIHDSGRAPGCVYFSMEYIEGGDLSRRLREQPFAPRETAALVAKLASALAHAHAEGVLHRDLKPSNILLDGTEPRLADFGLAAQLENSGDFTSASGVFGTPHYLAPEALTGGGAALSAASDLYALGVVLYLLLTGRTPFAGASPAELPALVADNDPPAPRLLSPAVPRDLETICLKLLERDPARRYPSATALAADLHRFLAGEAIHASPPSRLDRFVRFVRRHRLAFAASTVASVALAAATIVSTALAVRARRAEQNAAAEAAAASAISDFLRQDLLAQASPDNQPDRDLKLRTLLDRAAKKIVGRFPDQPSVEAELHATLADTYAALGEHAIVKDELTRALALLRSSLDPDAPRILALTSRLATTLSQLGQNQVASALGRQTLARVERTLGPGHPQTIRTLLDLATIGQNAGDLAGAEAYAVRALDLARRVLGPDHRDTRRAITDLSSVYWSERKLALAEPLNLEAVAATRRALGPDHPDTLMAMHNLASVYWAAGKFADAEKLGLETLELRRRILGPDHPETLRTQNNLATTYTDEGRYAEAAELLARTLASRSQHLGPEHPDTLSTTMNLAMVDARADRLDPAAELLAPALEIARRTLGPDHSHTHTAAFNLADIRLHQGRLAEAQSLITAALEARRRTLGPSAPATLVAQEALASILLREEKLAEAEAILRATLTTREETAPDHWRTHAARYKLALVLLRENRPADAEPLLLRSAAAFATHPSDLPAAARYLVTESAARLAELYTTLDRTADAEIWRKKSSPP